MKITDFKVGDKICRKSWNMECYYHLKAGYANYFNDGINEGVHCLLLQDKELCNNEWEHWIPPEEKRKPETWYRFEWKLKGQRPEHCSGWYKSKEDFEKKLVCLNSSIFDLEPRVYEEREF